MADTEKKLRKLYELSLLLSGDPGEIIQQIAAMIAEFFTVRVVILSEIKDQKLYFLCVHIDGVLQTDLGHVPLAVTPRAVVKKGKQERFFNQLADLFPQVNFLKQKKVFFYYGAPTMDSAGKVISTICLLDEKHHKLNQQSVDLLRIFGQRIALELERKSSLIRQSETEQALQNSQSQRYNLSNISPVGIFRTDSKGQCIYVNDQWCQYSGLTLEQASSNGWINAVHPDDRSSVLETWTNAVRQRSDFKLEYRFLNSQNKVTWMMGRATTEKDDSGKITGYIGVVTDITDRKNQELENENIRLKLMEAQSIAHLGFFEYELDTGNTYWSEETYRLLGTTPQRTRPGFDSFISFVHPRDVPIVREAREELQHGGLYDIDYRIIKPDGSESILHSEAKLHIDIKNKRSKVIGTVQDISERKYVENALNILSGFSAQDNMDSFFKDMVYNLARAYNTRYAFLGLFAEGCEDKIALQAIWMGDGFGKNFEYSLENTPCADVLNGRMEIVAENAARLYPKDEVLARMEIDSYYGAPLITPSGKKIGLIAVMSTKPLHMGYWAKSILKLFAQRLASHIEYRCHEKEIKASQKKLSSILENMQDVYYRADCDGLLTMVSPSASAVLGYEVDDIIGMQLIDLYVNLEDRSKLLQALNDNNGKVYNFTAALHHKDGHNVWMSANVQYYYDEQGGVLGTEGVARDITQLYLDNLQMRKMSRALEQTADMVMITDKEGIIEYVNPMFEKTTGYCKQEIIGRKPSILNSGHHDRVFYKKMWATVLAGKVFTEVLVNKKRDDSVFYQDETITPLKNEKGEITHFIATGRDISRRMENEKRLQHIAHHDALTGLPNRVLFMDRIKRSLAHARRSHERIAILFFDLDRFKNINDTLGHIIGDKLLIEIARRLKKSIREDDSIARLGGDEFAVLVDKIGSENDITQVAQKTLTCLEKPAIIDGHSLYTTASIGISLFPDDGEDTGSLLKNADIAMYRAKDMGKNNYQFYSKDMSARAIQRLVMEDSLRTALEKNEFILYYQPWVDTQSHRITGVEVLLRWQHPEHGLILPAEFIPVLEETGLIIDVGDWVLERACSQLKDWIQSGYTDIIVSINISGRQFHKQNFYHRIVSLVEQYKISAKQLELEITEDILMDKQKTTIENISRLGSYGFRIAIDDFGTGHSSLSYLQRFGINTLKIDRSFIKDIIKSPDDMVITSAIIAMAHSLKLNIVAEGVETQQQLDFLHKHACQLIQGYFFSPPVTIEAMTQLLEETLIVS